MWRKDFDSKVRWPGVKVLGYPLGIDPRLADERHVGCTHSVRVTAQNETGFGSEQTARSFSAHMQRQLPPDIVDDRAMFRACRIHRSQLPFDQFVPHAIVGQYK